MGEENRTDIKRILLSGTSEIDVMKSMYHDLVESGIRPEVLLLGLPFYLAELMRDMTEDEILMWMNSLTAAVIRCHRHLSQSYAMYS